jgi:hypothetical protein
MREGDWIAMPRVPLIAAGSTKAAAGVEGDGANAPGDDARATEEATGPASDDVRIDRVAEPSDEAERAEVAVGTFVPFSPPPKPLLYPKRTPPPHLTRSSPPPPTLKKTLEATPRRWRMSQSSRPRC